jgi:hypothetical protein
LAGWRRWFFDFTCRSRLAGDGDFKGAIAGKPAPTVLVLGAVKAFNHANKNQKSERHAHEPQGQNPVPCRPPNGGSEPAPGYVFQCEVLWFLSLNSIE